jgi:uncharacterized repeat protein (TIGR03837 family)
MVFHIFCQVIDNFGDIGVCWRLSAQLAARGHAAHLWVDDASALAWMAPHGAPGVTVRSWADAERGIDLGDAPNVLIEAFGCNPPHAYLAHVFIAKNPAIPADFGTFDAKNTSKHPIWINLEYLSAEGFASSRPHQVFFLPRLCGRHRRLVARNPSG